MICACLSLHIGDSAYSGVGGNIWLSRSFEDTGEGGGSYVPLFIISLFTLISLPSLISKFY